MFEILTSLFRCSGCLNQSPAVSTFPLCEFCNASLLVCRDLKLPLTAPNSLQSLHSVYLLYEHGYTVLKRWKAARGPIFDHRVLSFDKTLRDALSNLQIDAIVPIPQNPQRLWQTESQTETLAIWLSRQLRIPIFHALKFIPPPNHKKRAELDLMDRLIQDLDFGITAEAKLLKGKNILLVDDFCTTGKTLTQAASVVLQNQARSVHGFCLGVRLAYTAHDSTERRLDHGARGPVAVCQQIDTFHPG